MSNLRTAGIVLSFAGMGYGTYRYAVQFGNLDPFAKFRGIDKIDMTAGIQLDRVNMRAYKAGVLVAKANVGSVTVTQDRNELEMTEIHDGVYRGDATDYRFEAQRGSYSLATQELQLRGNAGLMGKGFALRTALATLNRADQELDIRTDISGTLLGGKIRAASFHYAGKTGAAYSRLVHWQGKPPINPDIPGQEPTVARIWNIDPDHAYYDKTAAAMIYTNCKATDGEVLIYAPKAQWDRKNDILTATGRITYFSGKADVVADKVIIYRKEKKAIFSGNVVMLVKPKKDQDQPPKKEEIPEVKEAAQTGDKLELPKEDTVITPEDKEKADALRSGKNWRDYPLHLQAQEITYWYGKGSRHAVFSGDPVAKQDFPSGQWRMAWSNNGTYDGEKELLSLASKSGTRDVRYKNSIGDLALAKTAVFSTKEEDTEDDSDMDLTDSSGLYKDTSGEDEREPKQTRPGQPPGGLPPDIRRGPPGTGGTTPSGNPGKGNSSPGGPATTGSGTTGSGTTGAGT